MQGGSVYPASTLQDRFFMRVGGKKLVQVDVRVIAATNRNVEWMVNYVYCLAIDPSGNLYAGTKRGFFGGPP